jgi:hypothetical protein|tara:strand:+ start:657 stop:1040 length:384 start_codon:yes stop_codon:yes gene_type:complete
MEITRQMLQNIRPEITEALKPLAIKYGIDLSATSGVYGGLQGSIRVVLSATNEDGDDRRAWEYKKYAEDFGLKVEWLNQSYFASPHSYTIIGLDIKKKKNKLVLKRDDGSIRIAPVSIAIYYMGLQD